MSSSVISSDVKIEGNITGKGSIRIDGIVIGNIEFEDVFIATGGSVIGDINAKNFTNEGKFKGKVNTENTELKIESSSIINLHTEKLVIESSATVVGKIKCGGRISLPSDTVNKS